MPLRQVNLYSATTEELFERLAWFYTTVNQVQVYDAEGQGHPSSIVVYICGLTPVKLFFRLQLQKISPA